LLAVSWPVPPQRLVDRIVDRIAPIGTAVPIELAALGTVVLGTAVLIETVVLGIAALVWRTAQTKLPGHFGFHCRTNWLGLAAGVGTAAPIEPAAEIGT
jgi:hypothetical protein